MASLYFYYSAMNAGKTTTLLQSSYNYRERGMRTLLFTAAIDHRYQKGIIHSRIGLSQNAEVFDSTFDFAARLEELLEAGGDPIACILVDEAQFLTRDQVFQLCHIVDERHIPVLTYGLRTDYKGELFEGSKHLLALAENLIELKTICHCGRKATMNARLTPEGQMVRSGAQVMIGGNDLYTSTCRYHFNRGEVRAAEVPSEAPLDDDTL